MKPGEVKIILKNADGIDIGEYIITDGNTHKLYSPYGNQAINTQQLKAILAQHSNISSAAQGYTGTT